MTSRPRRVLVADDDDDLRASIAETLAGEGWEVREARDGAEALDLIRSFDPGVVLLDWRMPLMDGGEVLDAMRDRRERVPVVLITASAHVAELAARYQLRFHLGKPFGVDELLAVIARAQQA